LRGINIFKPRFLLLELLELLEFLKKKQLLQHEIQQLKLLLHHEVREVHVNHREMVLVHELLQVQLLRVLREIQ
jgi:hypothetical protein